MSSSQGPYNQAIKNARVALHQGQRGEARRWAQIAVGMAPELEDPWLLLAAVSSPEASLNYLNQALEINPESQLARRGLQWANQRLGEENSLSLEDTAPRKSRLYLEDTAPIKTHPSVAARRRTSVVPWGGAVFVACILAIILIGAGLAAWQGYPQLRNALAGDPLQIQATTNATTQALAQAGSGSLLVATGDSDQSTISNPVSQEEIPANAGQATASATPMQPVEPTPTYTNTPLPTDTPTPTFTPLPTATATQPPVAQAPANPPVQRPSEVTRIERWIEVDLSDQRVYAYEGDQLMRSFLVSTGTWKTPTVQGKFRIYYKYRSQTMSGPGYFLPGVPFVMYFYKDYSFHGTYWHNNFGTRMSHGCVNMRTEEAKWLYQWASLGTFVYVHK